MMIYTFLINHGFVLELVATTYVFVLSFERRKLFFLRVGLVIAIMLALSVFWFSVVPLNFLTKISKHSLLLFVSVWGIFFCYNTNFWTALFCSIGAFATQHFAFKIGYLLQTVLKDYINKYISDVIYVILSIIIYLLSYIIFAKRIRRGDVPYLENKQVIWLAIGLFMFTISFQNIFESLIDENNLALLVATTSYDLICCVLTLCIQYGMFVSGKLKENNKVMEHILHLQKEQLENSKNNIEIINIKVHDLKYMISSLGDKISKEELDQLNKAVSIYDLSLKTGNEALDVILAEKSLLCEKNGIKLNCMADGSSLSFMSASEIYSLFGNAVDNAITALLKINEPEKRLVSISVKKSLGMVSISIENYFTGKLQFENNLPLTTKADKAYHGFGIKSIKLIVEKYKGYITLKTDNDKFNLSILIPVRNNPI